MEMGEKRKREIKVEYFQSPCAISEVSVSFIHNISTQTKESTYEKRRMDEVTNT